jgi:hypothetical protein
MDQTHRFSEPQVPEELSSVVVTRIGDPTSVGDSIEVLNQDVIKLEPANFEITRISVPFSEGCLVYIKTTAPLRTRITSLVRQYEPTPMRLDPGTLHPRFTPKKQVSKSQFQSLILRKAN